MASSWLDLLSAAASGGVVVKLLDSLYAEYVRKRDTSERAEDLVDRHLDPILKAADELVGKARSLAEQDFSGLQQEPNESSADVEIQMPILSVLYLMGQFWARIQLLRIEGVYLNLGATNRGKSLLAFISAIESTRIRIVDRARQRGIGESLVERDSGGLRTLTYYEFVQKYVGSADIRMWFRPLLEMLQVSGKREHRQRFLLYAAVVHALIDHLDPKHFVSSDRPGWANKLTKKSRRSLQHRVFKLYLPFVHSPERYYMPPAVRSSGHAEE